MTTYFNKNYKTNHQKTINSYNLPMTYSTQETGDVAPLIKTLRLAYLTTKYPAVSHTFIRRELCELEARGHKILRLSMQSADDNLADPIDREEVGRTVACLDLPWWYYPFSMFRIVLLHPLHFYRALNTAITSGRRSHLGVLKHLGYLIAACSLLPIIRKEMVQHIHVHFGTNPAMVAQLINCLGGPSYSFTVHGPTEFDAPTGFNLPDKIANCIFVVAITDFCSAQLRRWSNPNDWRKIKIVHCSVGDDFFDAVQPITPNCKCFVCVGRLTAQKGQLVLIDAFSKLLASGHDAKLVFVGDGEMRPLIEQKILELNLQKHITITGYVSEADVRQYIKNSRTLVMPSFAEGLPMVIMEAFAVGRPVISTYIAGIPELVRVQENGWLVPAGNTEALAAAMADALLKTDEQLATMASAGRDVTYRHHRTKTEVDKLEKLLYTLVTNSSTQENK